jgi:predicted MFS family arabinose efflux permease
MAGPLLAASLTGDPVQVAGLMIAEQLAWMVFALPSGALVDRVDRRRAMTAASVLRIAVLALLGTAILLDSAPLPTLYAAFFLVGCAGLLYENAATAILPGVVGRDQLERANGRLHSARGVCRDLVAAPLGGLLFATAHWSPFALDVAALVLVAVLSLTLASNRAPPTERTSIAGSIKLGVRWLWHHRVLRTLTIIVAVSNVGLGAVFAILVLIATERLGLGSVGYGVLLTIVAVGGVAGGLTAARIVRWIGPGTALRAGMVIEVGTHLGLALTRDVITAGVFLSLLGFHLLVFSTINSSLRQSLVPATLLGRVHSAYRMSSNAGMLVGALLGGVLGRYLGLSAPFWLGFVAVGLVTMRMWPMLANSEIEAARRAAITKSTVSG